MSVLDAEEVLSCLPEEEQAKECAPMKEDVHSKCGKCRVIASAAVARAPHFSLSALYFGILRVLIPVCPQSD